jgi:hypothetical protein
MIRSARFLALATPLVAALLLSPAWPTRLSASAGADVVTGDMLNFNLRGMAEREDTSQPDRFQYTTDLYSLVTGERIGAATHSVVPTGPPFVFDVIDTFRLPDGDVVSHHRGSAVPDPDHPGFFLIGIHPEEKTIIPERGTGAYAGRTGRLRMSGYHDARKFPEQVGFDSFFFIELDPKP